ncbi:hypothetical protein [Aeromonas caviae]|uniref:hypothetical protein n=1 Tax=Aeromonas caviae TaxID=648 RepID=UPI003F74211D
MKVAILIFTLFFSFGLFSEEVPSEPSVTNGAVTSQESSDTNSKTPFNIPESVTIAKDIVNIMFFVAMASLALLSYLQARKTIFQPIKTEIFKYQLKAFEEVIGHFQNKGEIELRRDMDLDSIIDINSFELFYDYVKTFMDGEVSINKTIAREKMELAKGAFVSKEFAAEYFQPVGAEKSIVTPPQKPSDPALKLAQWNKKKYGMVHFTEKYSDSTSRISNFQNSPLLPSGLKKLLNDYHQLMVDAVTKVGVAIEEAGGDMPTYFPTKDSLESFNPSWVSNIHNNCCPKLEPKAIEILIFINNYLNVDNLQQSISPKKIS